MTRSEQPPESHSPLEPTSEEQREQSFGKVMRQAVDDLFTYEPIVNLLQGREDDEQIQALIEQRKQDLVDALEEKGWRSVDDFLAELQDSQENPDHLARLTFDGRNDVEKRVD